MRAKNTKGTKRVFPRINSRLRLINFMLVFALVGSIFLLFASAAPTPGMYGSVEQDQVNRINARRASIGKNGLQHIECLNALAEQHTLAMANSGSIYHSSNMSGRVQYACGGSWTIIGENVGVGYSSESIFNAYMNSSAHRANIDNGKFTRVGVGAYWGNDGRLYSTQMFASCSNCTSAWKTNATLAVDPRQPSPTRGNVDLANCRRIAGWAFDTNYSGGSSPVHIYIDGGGYNIGATNLDRPDVNAAYGISGTHGFDWVVPDHFRDGKQHTATIYAIDVKDGNHTVIGVRTLDACANPIGNIDVVNCDAVAGWSVDMNDPAASIETHLYIDGPPGGGAVAGINLGPTKTPRPDVNSAYAGYGVTGVHGFHWPNSGWKDGRQHSAWVYAINIGNGGHTFLGTRNFGPCY